MPLTWLDIYRYAVEAAGEQDRLLQTYRQRLKELSVSVYGQILTDRINKSGELTSLAIELPPVSHTEYMNREFQFLQSGERSFVVNPAYLYEDFVSSVAWVNYLVGKSPLSLDYTSPKAGGAVKVTLHIELA